MRRRAKSYSIVDHQILHGGYFRRLSHEALVLYLFLVVVSDREGKSYWAQKTIIEVLRMSPSIFVGAAKELIAEKLITHSKPYFWINNLEPSEGQRPIPELFTRDTCQE